MTGRYQRVVHLIFTTKSRRKRFDGRMIHPLREVFSSAVAKLGCERVYRSAHTVPNLIMLTL
ncbi:hypothetical protein EAE91_15140 [Photorhabdus noenieputensis]|nr:hypothetical protein [Photorhabdus noenieputensis]